jgi:hypothetical protein
MRIHFTDRRALAATVCWVAALALTGSTEALLFMAPALLIAIPLLGGRFFGEELIVRLATRRPRPRRRSAAAAPAPPPAPSVWLPRGARLIAASLAKRPPPAALIPQN